MCALAFYGQKLLPRLHKILGNLGPQKRQITTKFLCTLWKEGGKVHEKKSSLKRRENSKYVHRVHLESLCINQRVIITQVMHLICISCICKLLQKLLRWKEAKCFSFIHFRHFQAILSYSQPLADFWCSNFTIWSFWSHFKIKKIFKSK